MSILPEGWVLTRIGELGEVRLGKMLDKAKNQGEPVKYLRNINVRWFRFDLSDLQTILVTPYEREILSVRDGDLFVCEGGEPGRCAVWRQGANNLVYQKALHRIRTASGILPELLMYRLRYDAERGGLQEAFTGTTIRHLTRESLSRYEISLPPQNEQNRIANKLGALLTRLDTCRERLERVPLILERLRQSILAAATSGELTADWRENQGRNEAWRHVSLRETAIDISYGSSSKSLRAGSIPVLRMGNIQEGRLDWNDLLYTSDLSEIEKYKLMPGDVLFNRTNSPELVGKTAVYKGEQPAIHAGYLIRVRSSSELLPDYLNYNLNSPAGRDYCWQVKSDGVSQSNINAKKLANFQFELPPLEEQSEIIRRVESLFAYANRLETHYKAARARVERLTPALLGKAFRGELVPQDPKDEPASVLLERIRASRAVSEGALRVRGGADARTKAIGSLGKVKKSKAKIIMLKRKDVEPSHLSSILKASGPLSAEALWSASQLDIDDFYDQLKDEEARELLRETVGEQRLLEAA